MYEDSWYSIMPDLGGRGHSSSHSQSHGHRRKESLLQQPNVCLPRIGLAPHHAGEAHKMVTGTWTDIRGRSANAQRLRRDREHQHAPRTYRHPPSELVLGLISSGARTTVQGWKATTQEDGQEQSSMGSLAAHRLWCRGRIARAKGSRVVR